MSWLAPGTRVHVVGVGGAGMSGVARLLSEYGCVVSGSDARASTVLGDLAHAGVSVAVGADAAHGASAQVVLRSPAVPADHPELVAARARGATMVTRAELLGELAARTRVIGLTGTHGKTTATSTSTSCRTTVSSRPTPTPASSSSSWSRSSTACIRAWTDWSS